MPNAFRPCRRDVLMVVGLTLITCALFAQVRDFEFLQYDDDKFITDNPALAEGLTGDAVVWAFTTNHAALWLPLTWLSHLVDIEVFGMHGGRHHLVNLALHILNVLLLFVVLRGMTGAFWRSVLVAALFAWHPSHVESVAWVTERKDTLSTVFFLLTILAHHRFATRRTVGRYLVVAAWLVLGLMAKPMLVTLPVILLLLDVWPLGRATGADGRRDRASFRGLVLEKAPLLGVAFAVGLVTLLVGRSGGIVASLDQLPALPRLVNAAIAHGLYLVQFVWPVGLYAQVPFRLGAPLWQGIAATLAVLAITVLCLRGARRRPWLAVGWLWFLVSLAPVSGLLQQGAHGMADRYTYLAFIGLFVIVAWGGEEMARRWRVPGRAVAVLVVLWLTGLGALTHAQVATWRNNITLFEHALARNPDNPMAHTFLGLGLEARGDDTAATVAYRQAIELQGTNYAAHLHLARLHARTGDRDLAVVHFRAALGGYGDAPDVLLDLGNQLFLRGDHGGAIPYLERVLALEPDNPGALTNLALARLARGEFAAAEEALLTLDALTPTDPNVRYNLACVASRRGDVVAAAAHLGEALDRGFSNGATIRSDPDLAVLRAAPEFAVLVADHGLRD